ncbi:MAG: hypothetical protein HOI95_07880, partial [Chromatiales bacterium]|nr:hypothetical protein [Chromatiales bacterium]
MAESGLLSVDLELLFGPVNVEQGWQFLSEGRVYGARAESPDVIAGCIRGTLGESYEVSVTMRRERSGVAVDARCSCAARGACGHAVAVICHFVQLDRAGSPAVEARMDAPDAQWLADFAALASQCTTAGTGGSIRYVVTLEPDGDEAPHVRTFITQHDRSPAPYDPSDVLVNEANVQLEGADRTLLYELTDLGYGPQQGLQLDGVVGAAVFARIVETGRCTLQHASGQRLGLASPRHLVLDWRLNAEDGRFQIRLQSEPRSTRILNFSPLWYIDAATGDAGPIDTALPRVLVEELSCAPSVAPEGVGPMLGSLRRVLGSHLISVRDAPQIDELSQPPCHAVLHLSARRHADSQKPICEGQLSFEYAGLRVHPAHATSRVVRRVGERFVVINRSMEFETQAQRLLSAAGLIRAARGSNGPAQDNVWKPRGGDDQWPQFFIDGVPTLEAQGWTVEQDETFPFHRVDATRWLVNVSSIGSGDLVSVDICANEDGEARSVLRQVAQCLVERGCGASARPGECTALTLSDGGIVTAPLERVERIQRALAELGVSADAVAESGTLRVSRFQAAALVALDAPHVGLQVRGDAAVVSLGRRIAAFSGIRELPAPPGLGVTLRPYQRQALGWLGFLAEIGCGG